MKESKDIPEECLEEGALAGTRAPYDAHLMVMMDSQYETTRGQLCIAIAPSLRV